MDGLKPWSVSAHEAQHMVRRRQHFTDTKQLKSVRNTANRLQAGAGPCGRRKERSTALPGLRGEDDHITRGQTQCGRYHSKREVQLRALVEGVSSAREDMTCELSSPGREGVGIPSEAEEGPREGARRRDRKPSAQDGGDFTVSQQDSRDTVRYHTPKRIS